MSASLALPPAKVSPLSVLIQTQLRTTPRPPPPGTSLAGKTAVVTGSSSGLGRAASEQLLALGLSHLIMGVRDSARGEREAAALRAKYPKARVDVWTIEQESFDSVRAFAARCAHETDRLDMAILNAAFATPEWTVTADGHEAMLQVNYLSTALLALLLLPILKLSSTRHTSGPGRLTIVGSNLSLTERFPPTDKDPLLRWLDDARVHNPKGSSFGVAAAQHRQVTAKILGLMLVQKLGEHVDPDAVVVNTVDPGMVKGTKVGRRLPLLAKAFVWVVFALLARTLEQGAWTYVDAVAVQGRETHGGFLVNWALHPFHPDMYTAEGRATTERVWQETLRELAFADVAGALEAVRKGSGEGEGAS
ncbi:retinol dehydrogenase 14 [Achaetomium macrosporum]|uniref:Retinol dehydrogenase 14 n=1 Tax=Achaetomium macrosporum TaxID=79813 RepID=A0AAN7C5V0_9PEZI|nr:retinol dehydrogenase 14 [Achaetomium macrosporum]